MINIRIPVQMKKALEKTAQAEFNTVSGVLKRAAVEYMLQKGIDWKEKIPPDEPS